MTDQNRSAGILLFRQEKGERFYLFVKKEAGWLDIPKGRVEEGETDLDAAKREVAEETGIKSFRIVDGFNYELNYFFNVGGQNVHKFVKYFLAETKDKKVKISLEHIGYAWLNFEQALEALTFENLKELLVEADEFLVKKR